MMTPATLATLARRRAAGYDVVPSGHPVWRWWVRLYVFSGKIDETMRVTRWGAERVGRQFVEDMNRGWAS